MLLCNSLVCPENVQRRCTFEKGNPWYFSNLAIIDSYIHHGNDYHVPGGSLGNMKNALLLDLMYHAQRLLLMQGHRSPL